MQLPMTFKQYLSMIAEDDAIDAKLAQQDLLDAQLKQKELANNAAAEAKNAPIRRQQQQVAKTKGQLEKAKMSADKNAAQQAAKQNGQQSTTLTQPGQTRSQTPGSGTPGLPKQ